ncbi:phosphatidylinositol 3- and 4-kinase family protein [Cryptosporidium andersoni]|uniref:Phosphatidylinositol 3-and 4-kinase family protein n=1 Tax=Cryptosporidium andersoni TaxID=117008 RepID=A0A1J4MTB6_9CRYT|nr:phosphatidylinositol 3- and 4-kinase family protein [Cryptosporidium andersoni]
MYICIDRVALLSRRLFDCRLNNEFPVAVNIKCEIYLLDYMGGTSTKYTTRMGSEVYLINEADGEGADVVPLELELKIPVDNISLSSSVFSNYCCVAFLTLLDVNNTLQPEIGHSILPLTNMNGFLVSEYLRLLVMDSRSITEYIDMNSQSILKHLYSASLLIEFKENNIDLYELDNLKIVGIMHISLIDTENEPRLLYGQKIYNKIATVYSPSEYHTSLLLNSLNKLFLLGIRDPSWDSLWKFRKYKSPNKNLGIKNILPFLNGMKRIMYLNSRYLSLSPNPNNKKRIELILKGLYFGYFDKSLNISECDKKFLWDNRYLLPSITSAFPLWLRCLDLHDETILKELKNIIDRKLQILYSPCNSSMILSISDCLNLLSRDFKKFHFLRSFSIENLHFCSSKELHTILPQLIQSLRYETSDQLVSYLIKSVLNDMRLCIEFFWLLFSEISGEGYSLFLSTIFKLLDELTKLALTEESKSQNYCLYHHSLEIMDVLIYQMQFRTTILWIQRTCIEDNRRDKLDKKTQKFQRVLQSFENCQKLDFPDLLYISPPSVNRVAVKLVLCMRKLLEKELEYKTYCTNMNGCCMIDKNLHSSYIIWRTEISEFDKISNLLHDDIEKLGFPILNITNLGEPLPLPIDIKKALICIVPSDSFILKSSLCPFVLSCRMAIKNDLCPRESDSTVYKDLSNKADKSNLSHSIYQVIEGRYMYKVGDDLRQDRLVLQLLQTSSIFLKDWNFDSLITLYKVLPFSWNDGIIEFVDGVDSIGNLRKKYGKNCILQFWASKYRTRTDDIPFNVMNNFINSCAFYSVVTFILGIGDRHLDNLLIDVYGHFFHVDFGYIFGEDPKPFPPPMKVCTEMIEAMGGLDSYGFKLFIDKCCELYRYIRRNSWFIFNIVLLMIDSGIKDLSPRSTTSYIQILDKIKEKFQLDKSEITSENYLREIIISSSKALFPAVVDTLHDWALYWA